MMSRADPSRSSRGTENESHPLDWLQRNGASQVLLHELDARRRHRARRRRAAGMIGGALACAVLAGALWLQPRRMPPPSELPASATIVSVPERRTLADGSVAELKDDAVIRVDYTTRMRRVVLERGEAHFKVARNDRIPFVVEAGGVEVRAVGTAFSVRSAPVAVEVLVTEGRVAVGNARDRGQETGNRKPETGNQESGTTREAAPVVVGAGRRVTVESLGATPGGPQVTVISAAEMDHAMAWRVPRIEFSGTPLLEALPVFNRHARVRVTLGDPGLERLLLSGILRADNVDALVRLLEANYGVVADRREGEIVLRRR